MLAKPCNEICADADVDRYLPDVPFVPSSSTDVRNRSLPGVLKSVLQTRVLWKDSLICEVLRDGIARGQHRPIMPLCTSSTDSSGLQVDYTALPKHGSLRDRDACSFRAASPLACAVEGTLDFLYNLHTAYPVTDPVLRPLVQLTQYEESFKHLGYPHLRSLTLVDHWCH